MASCRNARGEFYDIVGRFGHHPSGLIVGGMVKPFFDRRGKHRSNIRILFGRSSPTPRPLFQEQPPSHGGGRLTGGRKGGTAGEG
jgi:hypothetical protein